MAPPSVNDRVLPQPCVIGSGAMRRNKVTVPELLQRKTSGPKIVVVTAYDATFARLFDQAGVDALLIGDSLGMVIQGHETTLPVTLSEMVYHSRAVARTVPRAHIVADMPFLSYQVSTEGAVEAAGLLVKEGGCESVKLEGGRTVAARVRAIVEAGIPVMGHVGMTPQSVHRFGGFRVQGRGEEAEARILDDACVLAESGVYAIVLESIYPELARRITEAVPVPTIGIGAGPHCDGQVLVGYDLLGLDIGPAPRFVRRYVDLGQQVVSATSRYADDVRRGDFPSDKESYRPPVEVRQDNSPGDDSPEDNSPEDKDGAP
jgi:3-methyl-2-oxobutanoate hydroxymethyltransferase